MADHIRYDLLTQQALRNVVRNVLADVAKKGLPGEHHFYITFDTHADGVALSQRLREQFPEKMTIILQHQFWDLSVGEESFDVGLSFSGVPERITVPFDAIGAFFDPSVQFGLQFEEVVERQDNQATPANAQKADGGELLAPQPPPVPAPARVESASPAPEKDSPQPETGGAEVVRLDRFRKK